MKECDKDIKMATAVTMGAFIRKVSRLFQLVIVAKRFNSVSDPYRHIMTLSTFGVVSQHSSLKNVHIVQNLFLWTPMRPLTKFTTYGLGDNLNLGSCHCFIFTSHKITVNSKEHIKVKEAGGPVFVLAVMGGQLLYATAHGRQQFKGTYS